ncbi:MAG TPA: lipoprotein-releasing ABC transporter permease subunit [Longimicrobiaceae bacterium]|nr:lipoprotein-releasing ABC transporter permease subunit [Longimicrobiaceae bacterium]
MSLEWFIARRYLSSQKGERFISLITLISIGGVFVGVMALIVVTAVMTGLQRDLRDKILGTNPHVWVTTYGNTMRVESWEGALSRVRDVEGVRAAAPFIHAEVGLRNPAGYAEFAILRGIDPGQDDEPVTDVVSKIREGELRLESTETGYPPLLLGDALASRFGLYAGDTVNVISLQDARTTALGGLMPTIRRFEVAGRFSTGMYEYDNKFMYTTLAAAQELTGLGTDVTGLEIRAVDAMAADQVADAIEAEMGLPYRAIDWQSQNASLFSALQLEKWAMGVILLLIVIVAAFNIISTLVMVVTDKTREIGILKSMGLTAKQVQRVFMIQGLVIGTVGSFSGAVAGLFVMWLLDRFELIAIPGDVYFIDHLPIAFDAGDIGIILALSLVISFVATIYPARQAARLQPVEAIRHD